MVRDRRWEAEKVNKTERGGNQFLQHLDGRLSLDNSCEYPRCLHLVWHEETLRRGRRIVKVDGAKGGPRAHRSSFFEGPSTRQ